MKKFIEDKDPSPETIKKIIKLYRKIEDEKKDEEKELAKMLEMATITRYTC